MIRFIKLRREHLEKVLGWRVKPEVTRYMYTDVECNLEKQYQWFEKIDKDDTCCYWVISYQNILIGVINLATIDKVSLRCTAGYYIGEMDYCQLGGIIPPYIYNYVFREMKFKKVYGEVVAGNNKILQLHKMYGFRQVGIYRDHVSKNGCFHDVILIELLSESWLECKRYERYIAQFPRDNYITNYQQGLKG